MQLFRITRGALALCFAFVRGRRRWRRRRPTRSSSACRRKCSASSRATQGAGRRPGAHPRGGRDQAPAVLRLRAHHRAGHGPQLAAGHARAAEAARRAVPRAPRAHVFGRARRSTATRRWTTSRCAPTRTPRRSPCARKSCARARRRCRSTTRWPRAASGWKVYDVIVGGVSLVTNYRDEFNEQIKSGGIDGLIKTLQAKNQGGEVSRAMDAARPRHRAPCRRRRSLALQRAC